MNKNTLLMFSGGIDSTASLLWMLDNTDDNIEVHHIQLMNNQKRSEIEKRASDKILDWFKKNKREFKYTESIIQIPTDNFIPLDMFVYMFVAGIMSQARNSQLNARLDRIVSGSIKIFNNGKGSRRINRVKRAQKIFDSVYFDNLRWDDTLGYFKESVEWYKPFLEWTKEDIVSYLPKELFSLCWWCRYPIKKGESYINCTECHSCLAVNRASGKMTEEEINKYIKLNRFLD